MLKAIWVFSSWVFCKNSCVSNSERATFRYSAKELSPPSNFSGFMVKLKKAKFLFSIFIRRLLMLSYFYFRYKIGKNQETFSQMIFKKLGLALVILGLGLNLGGCGWVLIGGGVAAGYKVATDPRSVGTQIDDAKITAKIKMKLIEDKDLKAFSIDVDTVNGVVTLTGVVENEYQRSKAVAIAKSVPGVKTIINNLQIKH
ncbi:MAG TPA: hypothetical protein DEA54_00650 [Thermodesulfobacterium commune]|nr:hypothetical protein [Thermodesulfobacterium commune]